jgi:hypothetical protein
MTVLSLFTEQIRMGASALVSALNAVPWEDDSGEDTDSSDDETSGQARITGKPGRPQGASMGFSMR